MFSSAHARPFAPMLWPLVCAALLLTACDRNQDNGNADMLSGQGAQDGSLDASTMDALTSAQEPAMDVTAAMAAQDTAQTAPAPAAAPKP